MNKVDVIIDPATGSIEAWFPFEEGADGGVEGAEVKNLDKKWRRKCIRKY